MPGLQGKPSGFCQEGGHPLKPPPRGLCPLGTFVTKRCGQKEKQFDHFEKLIDKAENPRVKQSLEKAKEKYEETMNKVVAGILELFIKEVKLYTKKGLIIDPASEILIEDAQYVIEHL